MTPPGTEVDPQVNSAPHEKRDLPARIARSMSIAALPTALVAIYATWHFGERCRELQCLGVVAFWVALAGSLIAHLPALALLRPRARTPGGRFARGALLLIGASGLAVAWLILVSNYDDWS